MTLKVVFAAALLPALGGQPLGVPGRITGMVADQTSAAVAHATIELFRTGGNEPLMAVTSDAQGKYILEGLAGGRYEVQADGIGFKSSIIRGVSIRAGEERKLTPIRLAIDLDEALCVLYIEQAKR